MQPVLVVDDDPIVRGLICRALDEEGIEVVEADDGQQALDEAARNRPRMVILDVTLPVLGSEAVAAGLRQFVADDLRIMVITVALVRSGLSV